MYVAHSHGIRWCRIDDRRRLGRPSSSMDSAYPMVSTTHCRVCVLYNSLHNSCRSCGESMAPTSILMAWYSKRGIGFCRWIIVVGSAGIRVLLANLDISGDIQKVSSALFWGTVLCWNSQCCTGCAIFNLSDADYTYVGKASTCVRGSIPV